MVFLLTQATRKAFMTNGLTRQQIARKAQLIAQVRAGLSTFLDVGRALMELQEDKLYRDTHLTFEKFMRDEIGIKKTLGYGYIQAAKVQATLSAIADKSLMPQTESQYRELAKAPEEKLPEVIARVSERIERSGRPATAKDYKAAVSLTLEGTVIKKTVLPVEPKTASKEPKVSKEEQIKTEIKKARSYAEYLQRTIDDLNRLKRDTVRHPKLIELCGQILAGLDRW